MDFLNFAFAALSIGIGAISWLNPAYAMSALDLHAGETTMGTSEIRASAGALFVGMGIGALILGSPAAFAMLGFCWLGAAVGRATSIWFDGFTQRKFIFFAVEAGVGLPALFLNI